jgi:hypothetical protein
MPTIPGGTERYAFPLPGAAAQPPADAYPHPRGRRDGSGEEEKRVRRRLRHHGRGASRQAPLIVRDQELGDPELVRVRSALGPPGERPRKQPGGGPDPSRHREAFMRLADPSAAAGEGGEAA